MARTLKKLLSLVLVAALFVSVVPTQAFAVEETEVYLPEIEIGNDILDYDVFYLATAAASVEESGNHAYLLRVGRGGPADSESTALIKIADMTAKYGEDYVVRVRDERMKVDNPKDNFSLMEMMEGTDFEQGELGTEDELAGMLENDPEAREAYTEGMNTALEFLEEASGFGDKYGDENPYAEAVEEIYGGAEWDAGAIPAAQDGETITIGGSADAESDPLRQAVNFFTGQDAAPQRLTSEGDMFQDLQAIANVMTNVVVGASVELTFAPGETEKYLEIVPRDNRTGDGDRMFYIILGAPGGTTTNSAASSCAFTIVDDEEQEPAVVSFSDAVYHADSESVTVTVERSGAMNTVISTKIVTTGEGTARSGRDYSEVDAELVFPFGVDHLSLDIPVRTEYLTGEGSFGLALEPEAGCAAGENDTATVYLGGSYMGKASLYAARKTRMLSASGNSDPPKDVNTLQTVKTLTDGMGISSWVDWAGYQDPNNFRGNNRWRGDWNGYLLEWINGADREGTACVSWRHWDSGYYWTSGFQVDWQHGGGHSGDTAWLMAEVAGIDPPYWQDLGQHQASGNWNWYSFASSSRFGRTTVNLYPNQAQFDSWKGEAPYRIAIYNKGSCDNCDPVCIYDVKAILRPFQVNLKPTESLLYLSADGSRTKITNATTTKTYIAGKGSSVYYMDDEFTVYTPDADNVDVYGYMKNVNWVDENGRKIMSIAANTTDNNTTSAITVKLTKDVINRMGKTDTEAFKAMLKKIPYNEDTQKHINYGYANYALMNIQAEFGYIDSSVTLRNPYDFPVTMTISGTQYELAAKETRQIKAPDGQEFHLGDTLAVTKIDLGAASSGHFTPVGISYWAVNIKTGDLANGTMNFSGNDAVNVAGFDGDGRLITKEIIVEPNLQEEDNQIVVRVKTEELAKFDTTSERAGLLGQKGTVDGDYTYFTYADKSKTVNGKLYPITVTPLSKETVATWYDGVAKRTYVGNTLYFTAGISASRNIITLSAASATGSVTLEGTLKYANYNMHSRFSGNASNVPAVGAVLSAGSAGGVANKEGFITAGPIPITGFSDQYLRYIVSVNGTDVVKELLLPTTAASLNAPTMLWDFGADNAMDAKMGANRNNLVTYAGETDDDGNDYYTFTAAGADPFVSVDMPVGSVDGIQWVKVRARNLSGAAVMELYSCTGTNANVRGASCTQIELRQDAEWHEYIINIPAENIKTANAYKGANLTSTAWSGNINWIRLDPMAKDRTGGGVSKGDRIQIDYIAFFDSEGKAKAYRAEAGEDVSAAIDISSNFQDGINPAASAIFRDISITGTMTGGYEISNYTFIPAVEGQTATMTVTVKPKEYRYTTTGEGGTLIEDFLTEAPLAIQLVVYDQNDIYKGMYEAVDSPQMTFDAKGNITYSFQSHLDFSDPADCMELSDEEGNLILDSDGNPIYVAIDGEGNPQRDENGEYVIVHPDVGLIPSAGDKLYLRLTTNRLAQTGDLTNPDGVTTYNEYIYSDVFTGMSFVRPATEEVPLQAGIDMPIDIAYGDLPFVGSTGMNLSFPFVTVGVMKIYHGWRIYFGVSPVQIMDTVKGTHLSSMSGAGGEYWSELFSMGSPIESFKNGISQAVEVVDMYKSAAMDAKANKESFSAMSLGSPSWQFDLSIGMYFDFVAADITQNGYTEKDMIFSGMGGYVSVSLGFSMAWYVILPVVFLPAYFGIELNGTVLGFLGADFNKDVKISYDSLHGEARVKDGVNRLEGAIRGLASVQISFGVGLCGTLGVRLSGQVDMIANWEPNDPNGSWGFYVTLSVGGLIDLFLFSIPLMFEVGGWPYGSFEYYANNTDSQTVHSNTRNSTLMLREGSEDESTWLGNKMKLQGAFRPNKQKEAILAVEPYERPDSQLITLSDGKTLALAFIDSDSRKDVTQRTTLKLSIYDADMGLWSEPVPVAGDNTADFQPSIGQMKDGRLLVAWVSTSDDTITDVSTDEQAMKYLESMDVYTAFVELDENKQIRTKNDPIYDVIADTEVTRITNDRFSDYYDANPTVVCDMETGDAIVYYIKSDRAYSLERKDGEDVGEYLNPYTNDSVVSYMIYSAQGVEVTKAGNTVTEHWLFDYYYPGERDHNTDGMTDEEAEGAYAMLNILFGGQRFLDGPVNNENKRYAIPDFTAIGYDGMSICAYTIDSDGKSDTDADKELYLQVYDFRNHRTKYQTILTGDGVADTLPQLFRSRVNTGSGSEAHTKLFWYRDGKHVVYIDVTELLDKGLNDDGTLKQKGDGTTEYTYTDEQGMLHTAPDVRDYIYTDADGRTHSRFTDPQVVYFYADDSHAALQSADFQAVEDDRGNLYILWTEGVTKEDGSPAREIFGTGLVSYESSYTDENGNTVTESISSGWSKPYQITDDGYHNDELAVAMSGENLITVHNRYSQTLNIPDTDTSTQGDKNTYSGETDASPLIISDMALVAETLEPCGSVETESIRLYGADGAAVTLPNGGDTLTIEVEVSNNGMNTAQGYKLSLYADDTPVGEIESTDALVPNNHRTHTFQYTLPADVEGLTFKAVAQEMRDAEYEIYYRDTDTYIADPLEARASYEISGVETYQSADGFHARFTVTNTGNAPSSGEDTLNMKLRGPADLGDLYTDALYSGGISLAVGESRDFDLPVAILPEMMEDFGFVTALITVQKEVVEQTVGDTELKGLRYLSNLVYADFDLVVPMDMELQDVKVAVDNSAEIAFAMRLGDRFGSGNDSVTYAVDDLTVAKVENGKVVGVNGGETTLHATHTVTGATVSATVTVTGEREKPDLEITPTAMSLKAGDTDVISCSTPHEGDLTFTSSDPRVVIVDENGKVTAVGAGTATITVTLTDAAGNTYTKTMTVTVSAPVMPVIPTPVVPSPAEPSPAAPDPEEAEPCDGGDGCLLSAFDDLDPTAWYHDGVHWALENGIMNGYGDGKFGPNDTTTRAMIVTMLYRLEGSPMIRSGMPFNDVTEKDWYAMAVSWAESKGIVTGYGDGKFGPNDILTREQFATILYRYAKMKGLGFTGLWAFQLSFDDASEVSDWAYEAICWMTMQGIINGVGDNKLSPKGSATRAQVATMLMRFEAIEQ